MHSPACAQARAELDAASDEAATNHTPRTRRLEAARNAAAKLCLGPSTGHAQRSGAPDPVARVPAPVIDVPRRPAPPVVAAAPLPPLAIDRPATITTCDPGGCWDSQGRRLSQVGPGPVMAAPGGLCIVQGATVSCH